MKKTILFLTLLGTLVFSLFLTVPVLATPSPCGWSALPMTDAADDVFKYVPPFNPDTPLKGTYGAFHPEIDIRRVFALGPDLYIEFDSTPQIGANYTYTIFIDTNNDENSEYRLLSNYGDHHLNLMRESDGSFWNGTGWSGANQMTMESISGYNLTFQDMDEYLPTFNTAKYAVEVYYLGDMPYLYADSAPLNLGGGGGIPGFVWLFTCFGIITILGMVFLYKREITPQ
jgi:hypothetical protein